MNTEQFLAICAAFFLILTLGTIVFALLEYWLYKRREKQPVHATSSAQHVATMPTPQVFTLTESREKVGTKPPVPVQSMSVAPTPISTNLPLPKPSVQNKPSMPMASSLPLSAAFATKPATSVPPPLPRSHANLVVEGDGTQLSSPPKLQPTPQLQFTPIAAFPIVQPDSIPTEERLLQGQVVGTSSSMEPPQIFKQLAEEQVEMEEVGTARQIEYAATEATQAQVYTEMPKPLPEPEVMVNMPKTIPVPPPLPVMPKQEPDTLRSASVASLIVVPVSLGNVKAVSKPVSVKKPAAVLPPVTKPQPTPTRKPQQVAEKKNNTLLWY